MGIDAENDGEIALQDFPKPRYVSKRRISLAKRPTHEHLIHHENENSCLWSARIHR